MPSHQPRPRPPLPSRSSARKPSLVLGHGRRCETGGVRVSAERVADQNDVVARRRQRAVGLVGHADRETARVRNRAATARKIEELRLDRADRARGGLRPGVVMRNHIACGRVPSPSCRRSYAARAAAFATCAGPGNLDERGAEDRASGELRCMIQELARAPIVNRARGGRWLKATVNNGVNVEALLAAREALKGAPEAAKFKWRASCKWQNGTHSQTMVQGFHGLGAEQKHKTEFSFDADHPEIFASEDLGITPVEYVLVGLASCLTAGVAAVAQNRGIQLRSVEAKLEGSMDIQGILGIDSDVRNGYDDIKVTFNIDADASKKDIEALVAQSQKRSAVYDLVTNPTNVTVEVVSLASGDEPPVERVTTVVIGAGHAGLAASRCLTERSIDHVVLERGEVANSWRREALGLAAAADAELAEPPARLSLRRRRSRRLHDDGRGRRLHLALRRAVRRAGADPHHGHVGEPTTSYHVATDRATSAAAPWCWRAAPATSASCRASARRCRRHRCLLHPSTTAIPEQLPEGGVLVVGASATGVQLAEEIHRSGRPVTLSVGEHVRLPRTYRGRDVLWWMDASGVWNQRYDEIDDLTRARLPSPQLVGTPEHDARPQRARRPGVALVGRLAAIRDGRALFSGGLRNLFALADLKMERLLDTFDEWARAMTGDATPTAGALRADSRARRRRLISISERGDPLDPLGDRLSSRLPLARRARRRSQRPAAARRRRRPTRRACTIGLPVLRKSTFITAPRTTRAR